jgi:hypothetical protein
MDRHLLPILLPAADLSKPMLLAKIGLLLCPKDALQELLLHVGTAFSGVEKPLLPSAGLPAGESCQGWGDGRPEHARDPEMQQPQDSCLRLSG